MKHISLLFLFIILFLSVSAQSIAKRVDIPNIKAWSSPDILIIEGVVEKERYVNNTAYYGIDVKKVHKPAKAHNPGRITVKNSYYHSTVAIRLNKGENVILFVKEIGNGYYASLREINLDTQYGKETGAGVKLFLGLMSIEDSKRSAECINSYDKGLSLPEKKAILDVMWETRSPAYSDTLLDMIKSENDPRLRSWAVVVFTNVSNGERAKELVYLLDDPNYDVKRQLLVLFGSKKIEEAVPKIESLLKENLSEMEDRQADSLRKIAKEALDKISGKSTTSYWVY
ncbi:MAG: HEAT repeat domain-containing protein [Candidatus Omnitrophica bacterium]|nr:HEAT repeat domain-containing protein [Candidatus Omnitrophota bacterium]